jgi:hypothetical protein
VSSCIRQADEYYRASERIGLVTQPLLQFYGAELLAKAVILCNNESVWLHDLQYHGLQTKLRKSKNKRSQTIKNENRSEIDWKIENEIAIINDGVFPFLCEAVNGEKPTTDNKLTFKELLRLVPDLLDRFRRHYSEPSNCFYLGSDPQHTASGRYEILFDPSENINTIRYLFPELDSDFKEQWRDRKTGLLSKKNMSIPPKYLTFEDGTIQGKYLIKPHQSGLYKSLPVLFAGLFILSNVVRYKPLHWINAIDGRADSISVVEAFCSIAYRRVPNDVLRYIWDEYFIYATPSYGSRW